MVPTVFGLIITVVAIVLMRRSSTSMLILLLTATLLGGAAAIDLPSLGGANIPPAHFVLVFLILRLFFYRSFNFGTVAAAIRANAFLAAFAIYGVLTAFILPNLFFHAISVPTMRSLGLSIFAVRPLQFSSQNITQSVYLLGTVLTAMASWIICSIEGRADRISKAFTVIAWIHMGFGILDLATAHSALHSLLDVFRNASYAQLDQNVEGVQRVAGIFPETSAFSGYAFALFVLHVEFWIRNQRSFATGVTVISLLGMLLITTSSTSYISLAIYSLVMSLRLCITPMRLAATKVALIFSFAILALTTVLVVSIFLPNMGLLMTHILEEMTFRKLHSASGIQRSFWAHKGWESFMTSGGLGIGTGSFRSSGFISAIAGSLGVFGIVTMGLYLVSLVRPWRIDMHDTSRSTAKLSASYGWAAVMGLIPAFLSSPSADPGLLFGVMAGIALAKPISLPAQRKGAVVRVALSQASAR
jgi:hypothetical protein